MGNERFERSAFGSGEHKKVKTGGHTRPQLALYIEEIYYLNHHFDPIKLNTPLPLCYRSPKIGPESQAETKAEKHESGHACDMTRLLRIAFRTWYVGHVAQSEMVVKGVTK